MASLIWVKMVYPLLISLLLLMQVDPQQVLEVNPTNPIAYGALVLVLGFVAWSQYKERVKITNMYLEHVEKSTALLALLESKMSTLDSAARDAESRNHPEQK